MSYHSEEQITLLPVHSPVHFGQTESSRFLPLACLGAAAGRQVHDGADLIEVALRVGGFLPDKRRLDGKYDPLYDLNGDRKIDDADLDAVASGATAARKR